MKTYPEMNRQIVGLLRQNPDAPHCLYAAQRIVELEARCKRLREWVADLLRQQIEQCPEHPLSAAKKELEQLRKQLAEMTAERDAAMKTDWRIGLAVTPKFRSHAAYGQLGIVRKIEGEICDVDIVTCGRVPKRLCEPIDDWVTA